MKDLKHIKRFNEHVENLKETSSNISDASGKYSYNIIKGDENTFELFLDEKLIGQSKFSNIEESGYFNEDHVEIYDFEILENFRNRGYSKILMTELLKYLSKFVKLVELHVAEDNKVAIKLYESMGFETYFSNYGHLSMFKRLKNNKRR
jgi:ribosomal protein S18 acetylase RimI-like enzyme